MRLVSQSRKRSKKRWRARREYCDEKVGRRLKQWWHWNCGLWHFVDVRSLAAIAWVQAIFAIVFSIVRTVEIIQEAEETGGDISYITLANAYFRTLLYVLCCIGEMRLVHRAAIIESRSDLISAAFLEIVIAVGPIH